MERMEGFNSYCRFRNNYRILNPIGEGSYGKVFAAERLRDGVRVALKYVDCQQSINGIKIPKEIILLMKTQHIDGVIKVLDYFSFNQKYVIVMEMYPTDLFDFIKKGVKECVARNFFRQIMDIVRECDKAQVIHGDIKPENILVRHDLQLVLTDFGSGLKSNETPSNRFFGTKDFLPPEWIVRGFYDGRKATVWSLGILLYFMLFADVPFHSNKEVVRCKLYLPNSITDECKDLISKCLSAHPECRLDYEGILEHPWMNESKL